MTVVGAISSTFPEINVEWRIDNFSPVVTDPAVIILSPVFQFLDCTCQMTVDPRHISEDPFIYLGLMMEPSNKSTRVNYAIGIKPGDSVLMESSKKACFHRRVPLYDWLPLIRKAELKERKSFLMPSDTLTLTCHIVPSPAQSDPQPPEFAELNKLSSDFKELYVSKKNSDITVLVKEERFEVHKAVLVARSPVFAAMFQHEMSETVTGVINVPDCDPNSFGDFLHYLYTGSLDCLTSDHALNLYVTAKKYEAHELVSFCEAHMKQNLSLENLCDVAILAEQYDNDGLMLSVQTFFNENSGKIFLTSEWRSLMRKNDVLASNLLIGMSK